VNSHSRFCQAHSRRKNYLAAVLVAGNRVFAACSFKRRAAASGHLSAGMNDGLDKACPKPGISDFDSRP
jgi:hypothetical protein